MSVPRQHPIHERVRLAEETVKAMWRAYNAFIAVPSGRDDEWKGEAWEIYQRCMRCEQSLERFKTMRDSALDPDKIMSLPSGKRWNMGPES